MLYGSYESKNELPPLILPVKDVNFFQRFSPVKGKPFSELEHKMIVDVMNALKPRIIAAESFEMMRKTMVESSAPSLLGASFNSYAMVNCDDDFDTGDAFVEWRVVFSGEKAEDICKMVELPDGSCYIGEWKDGKRHGKGTQKFVDGSSFDGSFVSNEFHGFGEYLYSDGTKYTGEFHNGEIHGHGKCVYSFGDIYEGNFVNGERHGTGVLLSDEGRYEGEFSHDDIEGRGSFKYKDGVHYVGEFRAGLYNGVGYISYSDGSSYTGYFDVGLRHGEGKFLPYKYGRLVH